MAVDVPADTEAAPDKDDPPAEVAPAEAEETKEA